MQGPNVDPFGPNLVVFLGADHFLSQRKAYLPIEKFAHAPESVEDEICEEWETMFRPWEPSPE
jgi:hypothetical protein